MSLVVDSRIRQAFLSVGERLLEERGPEGCWRGELSASALSTATATFALEALAARWSRGADKDRDMWTALAERGRGWLIRNVNADGGWGDTPTSPSNLSTTVLVWAALAAGAPHSKTLHTDAVGKTEAWIRRRTGGLERDVLSRAVREIYGEDHTFSVPILMMCALAGRLGEGADAFRDIPALPFELALFPRGLFKHLGLPVVSYALPALIAIGQTQHHHHPARFLPLRFLRQLARGHTLDLLASIQPRSGGFLEAIPLTSFVTMSLATCGEAGHPALRGVLERAAAFLASSIRADGSWPVDVDLATWVTTLSTNALCQPGAPQLLDPDARRAIVDALLDQHHVEVHPFTRADPGGWAWTDLTGGVPDADDTSGALLALARLAPDDPRALEAAELGVGWLLGLVNRDGGVPTFCRGWGKLPFDRSTPDLTAHALRAWRAWHRRLPPATAKRVERAARRAAGYLVRTQRKDGSWVPLWFGNQAAPERQNPTYGTARVLLAAGDASDGPLAAARQRGLAWLLGAQNRDGGWGGAANVASTPEETALALEALGALHRRSPSQEMETAGKRGLAHLLERLEAGDLERASPIGLYFADLWYSEKLYPWAFAAAALGRWLG